MSLLQANINVIEIKCNCDYRNGSSNRSLFLLPLRRSSKDQLRKCGDELWQFTFMNLCVNGGMFQYNDDLMLWWNLAVFKNMKPWTFASNFLPSIDFPFLSVCVFVRHKNTGSVFRLTSAAYQLLTSLSSSSWVQVILLSRENEN